MKSYLNSIYLNSPVCLQNILISLKGYLIRRRRFNKNFYLTLDYYENNYSQVDLNRLSLFLKHAMQSPFWSKRFEEYNVDIYSDDLIGELKKMPILTKKEVKDNIHAISIFCPNTITANTSGTTGSGLSFPYTIEMENRQWAIWWRYRRKLGLSLNDWCGWFGGRTIVNPKCSQPPFWRINRPGKQVLFSPFHLNKNTVNAYCKQISKSKLRWLHGYPSNLYMLCQLIQENQIDVPECLEIVTLGAENLYPFQRNFIQSTLNVRVYQHYGLAEGVSNISEDINHNLFVDQDFAYTEFVESESLPHGSKMIVGTNYNNFAFPLIRYFTGDIAKFKNGKSENEFLFEIDGRSEDYLVLNNGVRLGRLDHIFKDCVNIIEAQIYQKKNGETIFRVVKSVNYTIKDELILRSAIDERLTDQCSYSIDYVDSIKKTNSGKLRLVISEIN